MAFSICPYMPGVRVKTVYRVLLDLQGEDGLRAILDFYSDLNKRQDEQDIIG